MSFGDTLIRAGEVTARIEVLRLIKIMMKAAESGQPLGEALLKHKSTLEAELKGAVK